MATRTSQAEVLIGCKEQLERIEVAINGNGHEGIKERLARIEENLEDVTGITKENAVEIGKLAKIVEKVSVSMEAHHAKDHLSDLIKKKGFWAVLAIVFLVLHFVSTYIPNALDWGLRLIGLPALQIPLN